LPTGPTYKVTIPADIVDAHPPVNGAPEPYGLAIVFNVACAGHIEIVDVDPAAGPQTVPLGCFDEQHNKLPPSDYVIGFTRVYAYKERTNAHPRIDSVTLDGAPIATAPPSGDPKAPYGITIDRCKPGCDAVKLDVQVPQESQEINPGDVDPDGNTRSEQVWVDYYATDGSIGGEARLLYDPRKGKVSPSEISFRPSDEPREGFLFVVVHDNRDGANWLQIPLHIR
jgi:hypothetical protein